MLVSRPHSLLVRGTLGLAVFAPFFGLVAVIGLLFAPQSWIPEAKTFAFGPVFTIALLSMLAGAAASAYFRALVVSENTPDGPRQFWLESLRSRHGLSILAAPVFWYRVIWKGQSIAVAAEKA
jgi:hypothetical protein